MCLAPQWSSHQGPESRPCLCLSCLRMSSHLHSIQSWASNREGFRLKTDTQGGGSWERAPPSCRRGTACAPRQRLQTRAAAGRCAAPAAARPRSARTAPAGWARPCLAAAGLPQGACGAALMGPPAHGQDFRRTKGVIFAVSCANGFSGPLPVTCGATLLGLPAYGQESHNSMAQIGGSEILVASLVPMQRLCALDVQPKTCSLPIAVVASPAQQGSTPQCQGCSGPDPREAAYPADICGLKERLVTILKLQMCCSGTSAACTSSTMSTRQPSEPEMVFRCLRQRQESAGLQTAQLVRSMHVYSSALHHQARMPGHLPLYFPQRTPGVAHSSHLCTDGPTPSETAWMDHHRDRPCLRCCFTVCTAGQRV